LICPVCGTHVEDAESICPACHADLDMTRAMPRLQGTYCPGCGALVPSDLTQCPSCGMPVKSPVTSAQEVRAKREERAKLLSGVPLVDPDDAGEAIVPVDERPEREVPAPSIESAIPSEPEGYEGDSLSDRLPSMRTVVLAAVLALVLVGGFVLYLTHPWGEGALGSQTPDADLSQVGFPGVVSELVGQDGDNSNTDEELDAATYEDLTVCFDELQELDERVTQSAEDLLSVGKTGTDDERQQACDAAQALFDEIDDLADTVDAIDVSTGTYEDDQALLAELVECQSLRMKAVLKAWKIDASLADPTSNWEDVIASVEAQANATTGEDTYKQRYDELVEDFAPAEPTALEE